MILAALAAAALAAPQAPALDGALICDHRALRSGRWEEARADWLAALDADPRSPLAVDAAQALESLPADGLPPLDVASVLDIEARVVDAQASYVLRRIVQREFARRRFSGDPLPYPEDLFADFLTEWRLLGPLGTLDHNAPAWQAQVADAPELELRATHTAAWGEKLAWTPLLRGRNEAYVRPAEVVWPAGGVNYLLTFVRCDVDSAVLELRTRGELRAWWNGQEVIDVRRAGPLFRNDRFLVPVPVTDGWNALLLRVPGDESTGYAARLLAASGGRLACEERAAGEPGFPAWTRARFAVGAVEPPALPADPYAQHLLAQRHLRDLRPDLALALPGPDDAGTRPAWLAMRSRALGEAQHLPEEIERRAKLEVVRELAELGVSFADVRQDEVLRLLGEDQLEAALALAGEALRDDPDSGTFGVLRVLVLRAFDRTGLLARRPLEELVAAHPDLGAARYLLAGELESAGDLAGAYLHARAALTVNGADENIQELVVRLAGRRGGAALEELETCLREWLDAQPLAGRASALLHHVLLARGDISGALARARVRLSRAPRNPDLLREVAVLTTALGLDAEARATLEAVLARDPGDPSARRAAEAFGVANPAERFFAEFGPDPVEARAAAIDAQDASIAEALDSGMVYLFPDGASHHRYHTITLALDRRGTELLHEKPVQAFTRLAQVVKSDGRVLEPVVVGGAWVMPSLDPGDAVEMIWDNHTPGKRGVAPDLGWWRFASFEKPFVRSRYVIYVPDELPGELRTFHFEGTHEVHRWEDGQVHVFLASDMPRQPQEVWQPSFEELLPWLSYGGDRDIDILADEWRAAVTAQSTLPRSLEPELQAWIASVAGNAVGAARAQALYDALLARTLDFQGGSRATEVWLQKRGNPLFLLGALFERAGVPFEWGVLERPVSPELDPEPVRAFSGRTGFDQPLLRLALEDEHGAPLWIVTPPAKGFSFATIPDRMAGARALVFGAAGRRVEQLPRTQLEDSWNLDLDVLLTLAADRSATARGTVRVTSADGALMREQVGQLGAEDRSRALRGMAQSIMPGITLESLDMAVGQVGFQLGFQGQLPGLVKESGGEQRVGLMLQTQPQLSTGLGPAKRRWPLALRTSQRLRQRVRVEFGDAWKLVEAPEGFREERKGFVHALELEELDGALLVTRTLILRGLVVEAADMPAFLEAAAGREREEMRQLRVEPAR